MNHTTAKIISYTLQPLAMPFITVLLAFNADPFLAAYLNTETKFAIYSVLALNTFIVPTLLIVYLRRLNVISSLDVEKRRERFIPFAITLMLYIVTYILLKRSQLPDIIYSLMLGAVAAMMLAFVITLWWKISIHMTGIGGVVGVMCALFAEHMFFPAGILCALIITAGLIGTARLTLNIHTLSQVICGTALGFFSQYFCVRSGWII